MTESLVRGIPGIKVCATHEDACSGVHSRARSRTGQGVPWVGA